MKEAQPGKVETVVFVSYHWTKNCANGILEVTSIITIMTNVWCQDFQLKMLASTNVDTEAGDKINWL